MYVWNPSGNTISACWMGKNGPFRRQCIWITWWRLQMETFSALLALYAENSPVTGEFPSQRPVLQIFDIFFDLAWTNGWVDNRDADDLRRRCAHYDVTVMKNGTKAVFNFIWNLISDEINIVLNVYVISTCFINSISKFRPDACVAENHVNMVNVW